MKALAYAFAACLVLTLHSPAVAAPGDDVYAKPGHILSASDGARLNFYCMGSGSPTIVFDAGDGDWSPVWSFVQPQVAQWTRACSYDRAGYGFSGPGPKPRTVARLADELYSALQNGDIAGPYILVGHAFGSYPLRALAYKHMKEVAGFVLIDPDARDFETSDEMWQIWHGIFARNIAHLQLCRDAILAGKKIPLLSPPPDHPGWTCLDYSFRGMPERTFSPELNAKLTEIITTRVVLYNAIIGEHEAWPKDDIYLKKHRKSLGSRPLRVITANHHLTDTPDTPAARHLEHLRFNELEKQAETRLLGLSTNAKQEFMQSGGAFVQLDQPEVVIEAIRTVLDQSRSGAVAYNRKTIN